MRWVKCEDRLPKLNDEYILKTSLDVWEICDFEDGVWSGDLRGDEQNPEVVIEWLDENDTSDLESAFLAGRSTQHYDPDNPSTFDIPYFETFQDYLNSLK